jgi:hypothetical protein
MLCFWNKIVGNPDKLSGKIYRLLSKLFISGNSLNITNKVLFGLDQPVFSGLIKITIVIKQKSKIVIIILLAYFFTKHFKTIPCALQKNIIYILIVKRKFKYQYSNTNKTNNPLSVKLNTLNTKKHRLLGLL